MDLKTYLFGLPVSERDSFATRCATSVGHLRNIAYGYRDADQTLAVLIERESAGAVTVADLDPEFALVLTESGYVKQPRRKRAAPKQDAA